MPEDVCPVCGKPLAARAGRTGCVRGTAPPPAGRRPTGERRQPEGLTVQGLIDDIGRQAGRLVPSPSTPCYSTVAELSASVARLRRVARTARDTTEESGDSVTPAPVTELAETDFAALTEPYRREIQVHCYRMIGSLDEAEDLVQETFLRAWRARAGSRGAPVTRPGCTGSPPTPAWTSCAYRAPPAGTSRSPGMPRRRPQPPGRPGCSRIRTTCRPRSDSPEAAVVARETIELAFLAAHPAPAARQRAVLILRDVLGWLAAEIAGAAGDERGLGQQRSAAGPADPARAPAERRSDWRPVATDREQRAVLTGTWPPSSAPTSTR